MFEIKLDIIGTLPISRNIPLITDDSTLFLDESNFTMKFDREDNDFILLIRNRAPRLVRARIPKQVVVV